MKKNRSINISPEFFIREQGNWNYKYPDKLGLFTKLMGIVKLGEDEFVFKHEEIIALLKLYIACDEKNINMILNDNSGCVDRYEKELKEKLKEALI